MWEGWGKTIWAGWFVVRIGTYAGFVCGLREHIYGARVSRIRFTAYHNKQVCSRNKQLSFFLHRIASHLIQPQAASYSALIYTSCGPLYTIQPFCALYTITGIYPLLYFHQLHTLQHNTTPSVCDKPASLLYCPITTTYNSNVTTTSPSQHHNHTATKPTNNNNL